MIVLHLDMCRQTLSEVNLTVLVAESVGGKCQRLAGDGMAEGDAEGVEVEAVGFAAVVRRFRFDGVPSIQPVADDGA